MKTLQTLGAAMLFAIASSGHSSTAPPLSVQSPNGEISVAFAVRDLGPAYPAGERLCYRVFYKSAEVLSDSSLGLELAGVPDFMTGLQVAGTSHSERSGQWENRFGAPRVIPDNYREVVIHLAAQASGGHRLDLIIRAYK